MRAVSIAVSLRWDPNPFILLSLRSPRRPRTRRRWILLAQTRQADRDKAADHIAQIADAQRRHVEQQSGGLRDLVEANTALTQRIAAMTSEIHARTCGQAMAAAQRRRDSPTTTPSCGRRRRARLTHRRTADAPTAAHGEQSATWASLGWRARLQLPR
jgi:uncharacterized membrane protein